jgi:hypothetical protein
MQQDPRAQVVVSAACRALSAWASEEYGIRTRDAGPVIRGMLYRGEPAKGTPVASVLRAELAAIKRGADDISYELHLLVNRGGQAYQVTLELPVDHAWDQTPEEIRAAFVRGGEDRIVHLLYSAGEG